MKLIDNWRQWPRMYSQWAFMAIAGLQTSVLTIISSKFLAATILFFPNYTWGGLFEAIIAALAVTGFGARLLDQGLPKAEEKKDA